MMADGVIVESGVDRISALPDELLCHILSFLPTKMAVRASLLSKRWRYLHTFISSIDIDLDDIKIIINRFDRRGNHPAMLSQFINYVERDLLSIRSIKRFCLKWSHNSDFYPINEWIAALPCHNIQELELCNKHAPFKSCNGLLASLFSSETLVVLKLVNLLASDYYSSLKIPDEVSLPKLKVLHIRQTKVRYAQLNKLLSSCPVLDDLFLERVFPHDSRDTQELELCNKDTPSKPCNVLPASLFSSETLVVFKLVNFVASDHYSSLKIPDEVSLPKLKVLLIRQTKVRYAQLNKLLSSCPVLDDLFLKSVLPHDNRDTCRLDIFNATLRRLAIHFLSPSEAPAVEVVINCPALEYMSFYDLYKDQVFLAKHSLVEVVINSFHSRLPMDFVNAHEINVFKEIKYIQSLILLDYHLLRGMFKCKVDLPLFENLTYLKLSNSTFLLDPRCLEYLLAQCVVLKTLVFEVNYYPSNLTDKERNDIKYALKKFRLVGLLSHLKTVKFEIELYSLYGTEDVKKVLMKIIKFFLNNANILEELTIRFQYIDDAQQFSMMRELSAIPRVSKNCQVVLNDAMVPNAPKVKSLGLRFSSLVNSVNKSKKN